MSENIDLNKYILYTTKTNKVIFYMSPDCIKCNKAGIYKITNYKNGRIYIGSSKKIFNRLKEHVSYLQHNLSNQKFKQDIKDGNNIFIAEIINIPKCINYYQLIALERYYIKKYDPFYNINMPKANRENDFNALKDFQNDMLFNKKDKKSKEFFYITLKTIKQRIKILNIEEE